MTIDELCRSMPPVRRIEGARALIRERTRASGTVVAAIDDDPTGTQTVSGVRVFLGWSPPEMRRAIASADTLFFACTNSRGLAARAAGRLAEVVGRRLRRAAWRGTARVVLLSRSDSTLRGHFPVEVDGLARGFRFAPDALIIAPAFFEAGRYTADDVHWVEQGGDLVPASETEFARDPVFGYRSTDLRSWVEEKTGGRWRASDVVSLSLDLIRGGGPGAVADRLAGVSGGVPVIVNAAAYEDLEVVVLGIIDAERAGRRFLYRTAASFAKVRAGIADRDLLSAEEIGASAGPVLVVAGSWVGRTSRQLERVQAEGLADAVELRTAALVSAADYAEEVRRVARAASASLRGGRSAVVATSRVRVAARDPLAYGRRVMAGLCEAVARVTERPAAVVAKGGITSVEIARRALRAGDAFVPGQIIPGVPLWRLGDGSRFPGVPYVVFPGNVGGDDALVDVLRRLGA